MSGIDRLDSDAVVIMSKRNDREIHTTRKKQKNEHTNKRNKIMTIKVSTAKNKSKQHNAWANSPLALDEHPL
jgi:hypothetical protein